ncbi:MAG TPA: hypothetical protein VE173_13700, partial [Longimicrobiales bacterium]|nr:hypothetical protein [Longimicrobiales bacterium]
MGQGGVCDRLECRAAWVRRHREEERRVEELRKERARAALRDEGLEPDGESWSLTPANPAKPVPLSRERREAFLRHLRRTVAEAVAGSSEGSEPLRED